MILKFTFQNPSNQGIIEKILIRVANEENLKLGLSKDLENIYAFIEGDEEEIEKFSKKLANELPISIFLKSLNAEVVKEFKDDLKRDFPKISLPPCPKCLREVLDENSPFYYDIFHHCEVCGYEVTKKCNIENPKLLFENLAKKLKENGTIYIQTMNGKYEVSLNLENAEIIVAKDLAVISKFFMAFEGDAKALASIEKPIVTLKTNLEFKKEYGITNPAFDVKLPDCMVLVLLFENIDYPLIGLKKSEKSDDLSFEVETQEIIKAVVTDSKNKDILVYSGDRGIIPAYEFLDIRSDIIGRYKKYISYVNNGKIIIEIDEKKEAKEAKPSYAGYLGVLKQWNLEDKVTIGYTFYKEDDSKILLNSPKFGLVDYVNFEFYFSNYEEIFSLIASMNDTGKKLIENFKNKRKELFYNALNADISSKKRGIYYLWGLIGIVLGFGKDIEEAARTLLKYSNSALTKKGPRIDYKLENNNLNPLWAIRTAMSFNLAGVDNYLLSYGVIESFAEFLSNIYEEVNRDSALDGAIIVGDLFEGEFLNKIYSYINKNYPIFTPKALQISGGIESLGSLIINSNIK